jgi:hypothetical protein
MSGYGGNWENLEEMLRSMAEELGETVQHTMEQVDVDGIASTFGVDSDRAREWVDGAAGWMRAQFENMGEDMAQRAGSGNAPSDFNRPARPAPTEGPAPTPSPARTSTTGDDALRSAQPHPLDIPTDEQGAALAALESGRWTVEAGSNKLAPRGDGPAPSDALGLVRELRTRDWITAEGEMTLVGRHALSRWLEAPR